MASSSAYLSFAILGAVLILAVLLYSVIPKRFRWIVLLGCSYVAFWLISHKLIIFILLATLVTYFIGLQIEQVQLKTNALLQQPEVDKKALKKTCKSKQKAWIILGFVLDFGMLIGLKYLSYFAELAGSLLSLFSIETSIEVFNIGVPIGISFYTLMATSYLIDVYRGTENAEHNLGRLALFLSFFPQIMEGPICRYHQTAYHLFAGEPITHKNLSMGATRILWGLSKKMIVADRLNLFVKPVFAHYQNYDGGVIALAAIFYTIQLYCDFSGCIDMAIGAGRIFGVTIPENFKHPFFSKTASEFWQRWHITLGTWLKDYIFYPVSMSKPIKKLTKSARKTFGNRVGPLITTTIALFFVWIINGFWHGAGSQYIFFGMYYFVLITLGGFMEPVMQIISQKLHFSRQVKWYKALQLLKTLIIIFIGELFFRAEGLDAGLSMFTQIISNFSLATITSSALIEIGMKEADYLVIIVAVLILLIVAVIEERGTDIFEWIYSRPLAIRWAIIIAVILCFVIFGSYGRGSSPLGPIYAAF